MQVIEKNKVGRPTLYQPEFCEEANKLALLSLTDQQLANYFEIDISNYYRWKNEHPEFCEAIKNGRERADANVASALYARANGLSIQDGVDKDGNPIVRQIPADPTSMIFWLKNRQPDKWRDVKKIDVAISGEVIHSVTELREQLQGEVIDVEGKLIAE